MPVLVQVHDATSHAFLYGMRTAVVVGAVFLLLAIAVAYRYLPSRATHFEADSPESEEAVRAPVDDGLYA